MTDEHPPAPGHDEIIVTAPAGRQVCHSRGHARLGVLAEVVVTFGELGTRWQPDAVFQDCWGRSYPMCSECWLVSEVPAGLPLAAGTQASHTGGAKGVHR